MARIVTLGEIMLRLKSPALERFFQSPSLEATFGGGEANVAVSLANYGMDAAFVTALPNNAIGEACLRDVRSFGVDVSNIKMMDGGMAADFPLFGLFLVGTNGHYSIKPFMWQGKTQFLRPSRPP